MVMTSSKINKSLVGTFSVPTPNDLAKAKIEHEKKEAAAAIEIAKRKAAKEREQATRLANLAKAKAARDAEIAKQEAEHRSYVIRYVIFIGLCLLGVIYVIKGFIYVCNDWFDLYFTQVDVFTGIIAGGLIGVFYFGIVGGIVAGIGCGLFKLFKLEK